MYSAVLTNLIAAVHIYTAKSYLTTEWLPWLQTSWRDSGYQRFALVY